MILLEAICLGQNGTSNSYIRNLGFHNSNTLRSFSQNMLGSENTDAETPLVYGYIRSYRDLKIYISNFSALATDDP